MKKLVSILSIIFLAGCATQVPTLNFMPIDMPPSGHKIDAQLKSITVSIAKEEERLGETQVGYLGNQYEIAFRLSFKEALEEALARSAIFQDGSKNYISLSSKVMEFQTPDAGINFDTNMIVRYELIDRNTGKAIFQKDISSLGNVPYTYAFLAVTRHAEARNRAVQLNVINFINSLKNVTFPK